MRIAVFGTGFVGKSIIRLATDRGWEIVSVTNRAGPKVGQDAGRLAGLDHDLGVVVEDLEHADVDRAGADIALIAGPDLIHQCLPIWERYLRAGIDVLTCGSHAYKPSIVDAEQARAIDALARANAATFTGGGLWDSTRIWPGLTATGTALRLDGVDYATDTEALRQGVHWAPRLGVGLTVDEFDEEIGREVSPMNDVLKLAAWIVLDENGIKVTDVSMRQEPVTFDEDVWSEHLKREIPAGRCVGTRILIDIETRHGVTSHSRFDYRVFRPGEVEHGTWTVRGLPGMEVRVVRDDSDVGMAASLFSRVPGVLAADPGIVTIMDLGPARRQAHVVAT
jgi:4-hydroxy-tetrahydrodipicolinate reductase